MAARQEGRKKGFFFEKKNQKTLLSWRPAYGHQRDAKLKEVFLLLFLQKKKIS